ncbi:MAG: glycosyltransferase [Bilophila wadsworthia]
MNNRASFLVSFWSVLISRLQEEGHQVTCLVPVGDSEAEATLKGFGASIRNYPLDNKGLNPVHDLKTCLALYRIFREERADILYASTIKSVIYGIPMAALAGIRSRYAMITGLGYMFEANTSKKMLTYLASSLYRISLSFSDAVFFQNTDDVQTFRDWHCLPRGAHVVMTKGGSGHGQVCRGTSSRSPLTFLLVEGFLKPRDCMNMRKRHVW